MALGAAELIPIALVLIGGAISPGPSLAVVLRNTIAGGRARGIACSIGHGLGMGLYAFLAVSGIAFLKSSGKTFSTILEISGAFCLVWIAIMMLRSNGNRDGDGLQVQHSGKRDGFIEGFLIAFFNPKIFVFLTAIFSQFVVAGIPFADKIVLASLAFVIDTSWYLIVSIALSGTALLEALRHRGRLIDIIVAIILLGLAVAIFSKHLIY